MKPSYIHVYIMSATGKLHQGLSCSLTMARVLESKTPVIILSQHAARCTTVLKNIAHHAPTVTRNPTSPLFELLCVYVYVCVRERESQSECVHTHTLPLSPSLSVCLSVSRHDVVGMMNTILNVCVFTIVFWALNLSMSWHF